jgi:hypothetical protein
MAACCRSQNDKRFSSSQEPSYAHEVHCQQWRAFQLIKFTFIVTTEVLDEREAQQHQDQQNDAEVQGHRTRICIQNCVQQKSRELNETQHDAACPASFLMLFCVLPTSSYQQQKTRNISLRPQGPKSSVGRFPDACANYFSRPSASIAIFQSLLTKLLTPSVKAYAIGSLLSYK